MKCYSRLSENAQACQVLNKNLPAFLKDPPKNMLDEEGKKSYSNLMKNLGDSTTLRWTDILELAIAFNIYRKWRVYFITPSFRARRHFEYSFIKISWPISSIIDRYGVFL